MRHLLIVLFFVATSSSAWAFPDNGVLDTFTGVDDTSPPNANWTNAEIRAGGAGCDLEDNAAAPGMTGGFWGCYWNVQTFGPNVEAYGTIVNIGSTGFIAVCARLANIGSGTTDGYCVEETDGTPGDIIIYRVDNEVGTQLGATISQNIGTSDKLGIKIVGDQICAMFDDSGAGWTELGCRTDSTYTAAGYIGIYLNGNETVGALDDFGGGTVTARAVRAAPMVFP